MRRLWFALLLAASFQAVAQGTKPSITCQPVTDTMCHYTGCFLSFGGLAGVFGVTSGATEAVCALCNDSAEAIFFGYVKPGVGRCLATAAASNCIGCNWCIAVVHGCPDREVCIPKQEGDCDTSPITIAVNGPIQLGGLPTTFDIDADGQADRISWVDAGTPLLALDRNGNGRIDDGTELFGDSTPGSEKLNGYVALSMFDTNDDGWVTAAEGPALLLWFDGNIDGVSEPHELHSAWYFLGAIGTAYKDHNRSDQHGNRYAWKGWARLSDGRLTQTADVMFVRY
jgi:hypothetical protein